VVKQAVHYAFGGVCDATLTAKTADGALAAAGYADADMTRYVVENGAVPDDLLTRSQLKDWVNGVDPRLPMVADVVAHASPQCPPDYRISASLRSAGSCL
jgi:hypothetical protein